MVWGERSTRCALRHATQPCTFPHLPSWYTRATTHGQIADAISTGMQACRDAAFQANKERLERERTVAQKIAQA